MLSRLQRMARINARGRDQQPRIEALESRALLTTFTVSNTSDSGTGSLRAAINSANLDTATAGTVDTINFAITGTGVHTIALQSALPTLTRPIKIDGSSQPSTQTAERTPTIVLDGTNAGTGADGLTLLGPGGSTIDDLAIVNFGDSTNGGGRGILVNDGGGDTFTENYLGIDADGLTAKPDVVGIELKSANNVVGAAQTGAATDSPNLISGNLRNGILIDGSGAHNNQVIGNEIGTDSTRTRSVANLHGITIASASTNTIGGVNLVMHSLGNLISGNNVAPNYNTGIGINITGTSSGNVIAGNLIGTDGSGTKALSNIYGIYLGTVGATTGTDAITNTTIGGTTAGSGNTISGNGLGIFGNVASSLIAGNQIGPTAAGTGTIGNGYGIFLGATGTTIGGTTAIAKNTISGSGMIGSGGIGLSLSGDTNTVEGNSITNNELGIELHTTNSTIGGTAAGAGNSITGNSGDGLDIDANPGNTVQGNTITNKGSGINVILPAPGVVSASGSFALADKIGGTASGAGNILTGNIGAGVSVTANGSPYTGLTIQGNQISSNGELGIDLNGTSGVPILGTLAITSANSTTTGGEIRGIVNGTPGQTVTVDLYSNTAADPSGYGEGQTYLGTVAVVIGPGGLTGFTKTFTTSLGTSPIITATATDSSGSTSEFSAAFPNTITSTNLSLAQSISAATVASGGIVTLTATVTNTGSTTDHGVVFTNALATSLTNVTIDPSVGTASLDGNNNVVAELGDLAAGASATITISATTSTLGAISNTVGVVGTTPETTYSDNLSTQSFTVGTVARPMADLAITVTPSTTAPAIGSNLTYTVTVTNNGTSSATNVTVNDFLPLGTSTFISAVPSQGAAATVQGNLVTDVLGSIASGASATLAITATPTATGAFSNTANVSGAQLDPVNTNNSATSALTVGTAAGIPTIALSQTATPTAATVGQPQTITITVQNTGTITAYGVILVDQLPTGVTYTAGTPSQGATATINSSNIVTSNLGTIPAGGSATLTLTVVPTTTASLPNTAAVIASGNTGAIPIFSQATLSSPAGPAATSVVGSRSNAQLIVNFNEPITAASATTKANYLLYALGSTPRAITSSDRPIAITTAVYNATTNSVTLTPSRSINATQYYALVVVGNTTGGITDASGRKLIGTTGGTTGTNYSTTFLAGQLTQV